MEREEFSRAWNEFWRLPELARVPRAALSLIGRLSCCGIVTMPPLIGYSDKTRRTIVAWVDLGADAVFDVAVYEDGSAEWYFRECSREIAKHCDATTRVPWSEVPTEHLNRFAVNLESYDE